MKKIITVLLSSLMVVCLLCACGKTEQKDTSEETPVTAPSWQVGYIVDDFGDPTDDVCLQCSYKGSFSNTATTDEELTVDVYFVPATASENKMTAAFFFSLLEYNDHQATYVGSTDFVLKVKIGDEVYEEKLSGTPPNGYLCISNSEISEYTRSELLVKIYSELDKNEQDVRCIIESDNSKYEFKMNGNGFQEAVKEVMDHYKIGQ